MELLVCEKIATYVVVYREGCFGVLNNSFLGRSGVIFATPAICSQLRCL